MSDALPPVPSSLLPLIRDAAARHRVRTPLAVAICAQESSFDPDAWRPEPKYRYLWNVRNEVPFRRLTPEEISSEVAPPDFPFLGVSRAQEWWGQQSSWGLMQVMGAVAREHGYRRSFFPGLCKPEVGLEYGCRFLARLLARYDEQDAVSAYNAGRPTIDNNEKYVQPVLRWAAGYGAIGI